MAYNSSYTGAQIDAAISLNTDTLTNGQLIIGSTGSVPVAGSITADDGLTITLGAGTIELDLDLKANGGLVIDTNEVTVDLGASGITGTLVVGDGGTGLATITDHGILLGSGTGNITPTAVMTDGQLLVGQSAADPLPKTISGAVAIAADGTTTVTVANDSITIEKIQHGTLMPVSESDVGPALSRTDGTSYTTEATYKIYVPTDATTLKAVFRVQVASGGADVRVRFTVDGNASTEVGATSSWAWAAEVSLDCSAISGLVDLDIDLKAQASRTLDVQGWTFWWE